MRRGFSFPAPHSLGTRQGGDTHSPTHPAATAHTYRKWSRPERLYTFQAPRTAVAAGMGKAREADVPLSMEGKVGISACFGDLKKIKGPRGCSSTVCPKQLSAGRLGECSGSAPGVKILTLM